MEREIWREMERDGGRWSEERYGERWREME